MVLIFHRNKKPAMPQGNGMAGMDTEEYQTRIALLCDIAEEATSITQVSTLLERILRATQHTIGAAIITLFLNDEAKGQVHSPVSITKFEDKAEREADAIEVEIAGIAASNVTPVLVNNIAADTRFNPEGKNPADYAIRSIIAVPILRGKRVIGVLIAANKEDGGDFTTRDFEVIKGFASTEALILLVSMEITAIDNVNRLTLDHALLEGYRSTVHDLAAAIDVKDGYAYAHSRRTKEYAMLAAQSLSLSSQERQAIEFGALLHDAGKIGISRDILSKAGPLTEDEWEIIRQHPQKGADILEDIQYLKEARDIVLYHHERYDGKGYPAQLKGEEIPIGARLVAVANAFDTMTTDHSYRPAITINEALKELIECTGTQFCPKAIEAFVSAFKKYDGHLPVSKKTEELKTKAAKKAEEPKAKDKKEKKDKKDKKEAKEVTKPAKTHKEAKKPAQEPKAPGNTDGEISRGNIRLTLPIAVRTDEVKRFGDELQRIEGINVVMLSHSEEEGHLFLLSLDKPIPLIRSVNEIPQVENIEKRGKEIRVILREEYS
jgi:putative nucleotidyltransferase with HDIG domain